MFAPTWLNCMHEGNIYTSKTESHVFALELLKGVEPNYGRQLWETLLSIDGRDVTQEYFGWSNYVHFDLRQYNFLSLDQKYFFVPSESQGFLIQTSSLRKFGLPGGDTGSFVGNIFYENYLLCIYTKRVILINLTNFVTNQIGLFENLYDYSLYIGKAYFENGELIIEGIMQGDTVKYKYNFKSLTVELV